MKLRYLAWPATLVAGWYGFFTLANVNTADIVAYNQLDKHVGSAAFRAGDLVEVSADGKRIIGSICVMSVPERSIRETQLSKRYVNGLRQALPDFASVIGWAKGLVIEGETEPLSVANYSVVPFEGSLTELTQPQPVMSNDCTCAVAETIIRRQKVCTVQKSMIEVSMRSVSPLNQSAPTQLVERTVGVTFRPFGQVIPDLGALNCPGLNIETRVPSQAPECSVGADWSADVTLREKLRVIREEDYQGPPSQ